MDKAIALQRINEQIGWLTSIEETVFGIPYIRRAIDAFCSEIDEIIERYHFFKNFEKILNELEINVVFIDPSEGDNYEQTLDTFLQKETFFAGGRRSDEFLARLQSELDCIKRLGVKRGDPIRVMRITDDYRTETIDAYLSYFYLYPEKVYTKGSDHYICTVMFAYKTEVNGQEYYRSLKYGDREHIIPLFPNR
jgi:hypothetical protein